MKKKRINILWMQIFALTYFFMAIILGILRMPYAFAMATVIASLAALKIMFLVEGRRIEDTIREGYNAK